MFEKIIRFTQKFFTVLCDNHGEISLSAVSKGEAYIPPDHALEALARCLYPAITAYFESEAGKREFAEWKEQQERKISQNPQ